MAWNGDIKKNPFSPLPVWVVECEAGSFALVADLVEYSLALFEWTGNHDDSVFARKAIEARSHDSNNVFSRDVAGEM